MSMLSEDFENQINECEDMILKLKNDIANLRAINAKLVEALEGLCSWESPLTQDKWDIAREAIAESKAVQG